jgi:PAS domain S-box-containing protein
MAAAPAAQWTAIPDFAQENAQRVADSRTAISNVKVACVPRELGDRNERLRDRTRAVWAALGAMRGVRSVSGKLMLVVLLTTAIALLVAGAALLFHDLTENRQAWAADLATEGGILALSTAPALAFDDRETAAQNLAALQARPSVRAAALYTPDGRLYASYAQRGEGQAPATAPAMHSGVHVNGERVELVQPIIQNGEVLGSIYLRARYDVVGRVRAYLGILSVVMCLSLAVALLLSSWLQSVITRPMESMANVARQIVNRRDYALRAVKTTGDEIGVVVDAFNNMLDEVQSRAGDLERANAALQDEVHVRLGAEAALAHASVRLQSMMGAAEIGGWVWDLRSNEVTVDRNFAVLYGRSDENELRGDPSVYRRQVHPDDLAIVQAADAVAKKTGILESIEYRIIRPDGSVRWVTSRGRAQLNEAGEPVLLPGLVIDITARKRAEQALRDSEKLYRAVGESIDYGVWVCDAAGRNVYASESFLRLTGLTQRECSEFGWTNAVHPDELAATISAWKECVQTGAPWYREHRVRGVDGRYHPILAQGVPIRDDQGRITGWAGINLDISRVKHTEEALREADRRKDEFLATLAHELRNPLAPIRHAVRILDTAAADDAQRRWGREVIARQVRHMAWLLDDLLDVSRITRGQLDLKKDYVDLQSIVDMAVETARPLIEAKRHVLSIDLPPAAVRLEVDPLRLSQVISNLLTNAAKYTDAGGQIALAARLNADELLISVKDTGIGLSPGTIPGLFTMFSQVNSAIDRAEGGLGIGLALVKGLVELHGGEVAASSEGLGRGSEFLVRLPHAVAKPQAASSLGAHPPLGAANGGARARLLVADDNRDAATTLATVLEMSGYEVHTAYSGAEALEAGVHFQPQAVLLDIGMPGMTGYETARRIRLEAWGRRVILIAVTGWGQDEDKRKAQVAGFDHHLTKPVDPEEIERLLGAALASRGAPAEFSARRVARDDIVEGPPPGEIDSLRPQ